MKNRFKLILLLALTSILSCSSNSEDEASENLKVDLGNASGLIIPASTHSCEERAKGVITGEGSIKNYFELPTPIFTWNGDKTFSEIRIVLLHLKIENSLMGSYECTLSGVSLGILFSNTAFDESGTAVILPWDQKLGYDALVEAYSTTESAFASRYPKRCYVICGGLNIEKLGRFKAKGTWEVFAVQRKYTDATKSAYDETPLKVRGDFTVEKPID